MGQEAWGGKILILSSPGVHRDKMSRDLAASGFTTMFASDAKSAVELLAAHRPSVLIHDWNAVDTSQGAAFLQKVSRMSGFETLCTLVVADEITIPLMAVAGDCHVARVITRVTASLNLAAELRSAMTRDPDANPIAQIAKTLENARQYDQAEVDKQIEEAWEKWNRDPRVRLEFANLMFRRQDLAKSGEIAQDLHGREPHNVRVMNLLARIHMAQGEGDKAAEILAKANDLSPANPKRLVMLGDLFFQQGNGKAAKDCYAQALATDPNEKDAVTGMGKVLFNEGDANGMLELFRGSLSEEETAGFFNNAAIMAIRAGNFDEGVKLYETALQALRSRKLRPRVLYNLALAWYKQHDWAKAAKFAKLALKIDPEFAKAQRLLRDAEIHLVA